MGSLGWSPAVAMAACPNVIRLAERGYRRKVYGDHAVIFEAQGIKVEPLPADEDDEAARTPGGNVAAKFRAIAKAHNDRFGARRGIGALRSARKEPSDG